MWSEGRDPHEGRPQRAAVEPLLPEGARGGKSGRDTGEPRPWRAGARVSDLARRPWVGWVLPPRPDSVRASPVPGAPRPSKSHKRTPAPNPSPGGSPSPEPQARDPKASPPHKPRPPCKTPPRPVNPALPARPRPVRRAMVALKGVPALLSPELLYALARMGHGDEIGERCGPGPRGPPRGRRAGEACAGTPGPRRAGSWGGGVARASLASPAFFREPRPRGALGGAGRSFSPSPSPDGPRGFGAFSSPGAWSGHRGRLRVLWPLGRRPGPGRPLAWAAPDSLENRAAVDASPPPRQGPCPPRLPASPPGFQPCRLTAAGGGGAQPADLRPLWPRSAAGTGGEDGRRRPRGQG